MGYKIKLPLFEGPLDLLLYLVKKDHLNVYDIPIAKVTEQYIAYLELMQVLDLNVAGEFLVMAATLMEIKSKMLLPADEHSAQEEPEDPRAQLVQQLLEYERFKEIAETLRQRETERRDVFRRPGLDEKEIAALPAEYFEASIFDLISAFSRAMQETPKELFYQVIKDEFTVEEKTRDILRSLLMEPSVRLLNLFSRSTGKLEMIVTFLAVLELIRLKEVRARQSAAFGEIEIVRNSGDIEIDDGKENSQIPQEPDGSC
jgi:segregation and condensation protein A